MSYKLSLVASCFILCGCILTAYSGQVSEVRQTKGGLVIDLDGIYPNQAMVVYIPRYAEYKFPAFPNVGDTLSVKGQITQYKGTREIVITSPDDLKR